MKTDHNSLLPNDNAKKNNYKTILLSLVITLLLAAIITGIVYITVPSAKNSSSKKSTYTTSTSTKTNHTTPKARANKDKASTYHVNTAAYEPTWHTCSGCGGAMYFTQWQSDGFGNMYAYQVPCATCGGAGQLYY